ncbi:CDP-glycerol glycerophosphotransferase family protein [Aliikangiella maris]|uniref:CDP-glycerol glycerophosphotransferase family protein n=2 Tax=Aliikangiella maris TaxID=3162458 RepID=A0ABV3MMZ7_9GAMM
MTQAQNNIVVKKRYLFYISQNYSFEILRPIQQQILSRGDECAWFVEGSDVNLTFFRHNEQRLKSIEEAIAFNPHAVFVPGNIVPDFIPGVKVQVFHGLEWKKKGHFSIRGFFDLYCTHGPITTSRFNQMAKVARHFLVKETGWPKLDPLFQIAPYSLQTEKPVVLFAPTFSPNLTCAPILFEEIKRLVATDEHFWLVKFHPKMNPDWIAKYHTIQADNYRVVDTDSCLPLLKRAHVLLSDTSSIIGEFLLLNKPAITFNNAAPGEYLINIQSVNQLNNAINQALNNNTQLIQQITQANAQLHPFTDGLSAQRVLAATDQLIAHRPATLKRKPLNLLRKFKIRKKLNYWKL